MSIQDETTRFYDHIAPISFSEWFDNDTLVPILERFVRNFNPGPLILDLGCGTGGESRRLARLGASVIGIDLSDISLAYAKENVPEARFMKMDARKPAFRKHSFDGILEAGVLFHFTRDGQAAILKELHAMLKPGGVLLSIYPIGNDEGIQSITIRGNEFRRYRRFISEKEWAGTVLENGFSGHRVLEEAIHHPAHEWKAFEFYT